VWIVCKATDGFSTGTGVVIDRERRLVLTNFHVVGDNRTAAVFFPVREEGRLVADRQHYLDRKEKLGRISKVVSIDRKRDLALIQLPALPDDVVAIEMVPESVGPGDTVHSIGNPVSSGALWVYTSGTVRAVYRKQFRTESAAHDFTVIETQSPINPGDSGGPVVNGEGKLVGISQAMDKSARLISYCVDRSEVVAFLREDWKPVPSPLPELLARIDLTSRKLPEGSYAVDVPVPDAAPRTVHVSSEIETFDKAETRRVWCLAMTLGNQPAPEFLSKMLEQNGRTKLGAWTIERDAQGRMLLVYGAQLDATVTPESFRSALDYVARITQNAISELTPATPASGMSGTPAGEWFGRK
jgi:hypothetical protein